MVERRVIYDFYYRDNHYKSDDNKEDKPSWFMEIICFKIKKTRCRNLWCHSDKDIFILKKASNDGNICYS